MALRTFSGRRGLRDGIRNADLDYNFAQLDGGGSGGGSTEQTVTKVAHGYVALDCIRWNGTDWVKARANDVDTTALGVVVEVVDADTFTYAMTGTYTIAGHSLLDDEWYFLSEAVNGGLTATSPEISQPIVYVHDSSTVSIYAYRPSMGAGVEGPQGPQGIQGPEGPEGPSGPGVGDGDELDQLVVWDGTEWANNSTLRVGVDDGVYGTNGGANLMGKLAYDGKDPFRPQGKLPTPFYIVGDSLTSPNGGGLLQFTYDTDGAGNVTSVDVVSAGSGMTRSVYMSQRGPNSAMFWFTANVTNGSVISTTFDKQSGPFTANLTAEPFQQHSTTESWAHQLWNRYAIDGTVDATPATSVARPGTEYQFYNVPTASEGQIALITLGGNDAGGIDIGGGLTAGGQPADHTQAQFEAKLTTLCNNFTSAGYRVILHKAAYADIGLINNDPTWNEASDKVREGQENVADALGLEIWDLVTTNLGDYLHPTQDGADYMCQGIYPNMIAASISSGGSGGGQWDDVTGGINYADGNVGIGTVSPDVLLHVEAAATNRILIENTASGQAGLTFRSGANDTRIYQNGVNTSFQQLSNGYMNFYTNNTEAMRITSSGNVGIKTTNPSQALDVNGSIAVNGGIFHSSDVYEYRSGADTLSWRLGDPSYIYVSLKRQGDGSPLFTNASGDLALGSNNTERMRIDSSGNVGIGITSPIAALEVTRSGVTGQLAAFEALDQPFCNVWFSDTASSNNRSNYIGSTGDVIRFGTNATERMRIDSNGNLLVGTGTPPGGTDGIVVAVAPAGSGKCAITAWGQDVLTTGTVFQRFRLSNGTASGMIQSQGASAAAFASFSDIALKENVSDYQGALAEISALRPVTFDWKESGERAVGFIAQEVEKVFPENVSQDGEYKTLADMSPMTARLVKAIQELTARVEELEGANNE